MKKIIIGMLALLTVFCFVSCGNEEGTVPYKLIINCEEVLDNLDSDEYAIAKEKRSILPKEGIILEVEGKCPEGDNVYNRTIENLNKKKIHFQGTSGYFQAIANIFEKDCGPNSGWMIYINGKLAEKGAQDTIINPNDVIEIKYIVDSSSIFGDSDSSEKGETATDK